VVIVELLLFLTAAAVGVSLLFYLVARDRRYLRFIVQIVKFTLIVLLAVGLFFLAERLLVPIIGPLL
jgi:hypothetical protein